MISARTDFGAQTKDAFEPLHFGYFGDLAVKVVWAAAWFAPALLAISGMAIWWKRRLPRKKKQHPKAAVRCHAGEAESPGRSQSGVPYSDDYKAFR